MFFPFSRGATRNARNCDWIAALLTAKMILMMMIGRWCWRQQEKHGEKKSTVPRCATMIWWCQCWCWLLLVMRTTRDQHEWNKHSGQTDWDCDKDGNIKTEQQLYTTCTTINSNSFTLILILTMMVMVMIILITMKTTIMIVDDSCLAYILICNMFPTIDTIIHQEIWICGKSIITLVLTASYLFRQVAWKLNAKEAAAKKNVHSITCITYLSFKAAEATHIKSWISKSKITLGWIKSRFLVWP